MEFMRDDEDDDTGPAPRDSEFLAFVFRFSGFSVGDFKPQKLLLLGGFKIHMFDKTGTTCFF